MITESDAFLRSPEGLALEARAAAAMAELDAVLAEAERACPAGAGMRWILWGRGRLGLDSTYAEDANGNRIEPGP